MVVFSLVAALSPLALYLFFLAGINRRDRPLLIPGVWEAAALLFALSGFLLFSLPELLRHLYLNELASVPIDEEVAEPYEEIFQKWRLLWIIYYACVVVFALSLTLSRWNERSIYNVDLAAFRQALLRSFEELGVTARGRDQNTVVLFPESLDAEAMLDQGSPEVVAELAISFFPALCHVTLHWRRGSADFRRRLEQSLVCNLAEAGAANNPSANWCLGVACMLFGALVMLTAMWIFTFFFPPA